MLITKITNDSNDNDNNSNDSYNTWWERESSKAPNTSVAKQEEAPVCSEDPEVTTKGSVIKGHSINPRILSAYPARVMNLQYARFSAILEVVLFSFPLQDANTDAGLQMQLSRAVTMLQAKKPGRKCFPLRDLVDIIIPVSSSVFSSQYAKEGEREIRNFRGIGREWKFVGLSFTHFLSLTRIHAHTYTRARALRERERENSKYRERVNRTTVQNSSQQDEILKGGLNVILHHNPHFAMNSDTIHNFRSRMCLSDLSDFWYARRASCD